MKSLTARCGLAHPAPAADADDWPSYNRTPAGDRFAPQDDVTPDNVADLVEVCRYDLGRQTSFQAGPIVVDGTIYVTTDFDTVALDAFDCSEIWRTTEDCEPAGPLNVNRGAALLDGARLRRQRGRRQQGREGPHVRAQRQERRDRLGAVPRAPLGRRPLARAGGA